MSEKGSTHSFQHHSSHGNQQFGQSIKYPFTIKSNSFSNFARSKVHFSVIPIQVFLIHYEGFSLFPISC